MLARADSEGFRYPATGARGLGGIGSGFGEASIVPIINILGKFAFFGAEGASNWIDDNSFTDSLGGGYLLLSGPWRNGRNNNALGEHPGLGEVGAVGSASVQNQQPFPLKVPVMHVQDATGGGRAFTDEGRVLDVGINYVNTGVHADDVSDGTLDAAVLTPGFVEAGGSVTLTGVGFDVSMVGFDITIVGATSAGNDGTFTITGQTATTLTYVNGSGVTETAGAATYSVQIAGFVEAGGSVTLIGTGFDVSMVGKLLTVAGATSAGNDIVSVAIAAATATTLTYVNATGVTELAAGTFSVVLGDMTMRVPYANPISGRDVLIIPLGAGDVIVDPFGANARNPAGVDDEVDTPTVASGTKGLFISNGGLNGTGVGRWERFI